MFPAFISTPSNVVPAVCGDYLNYFIDKVTSVGQNSCVELSADIPATPVQTAVFEELETLQAVILLSLLTRDVLDMKLTNHLLDIISCQDVERGL